MNEIRIDSIIQGHVEADLKTRSSQTIPRKADLDKVSFVYDLSGTAINESRMLVEDTYLPVGSAGFGRTIISANNTTDNGNNQQHARLFAVSAGISYTPISIAADAGNTITIQIKISGSGYIATKSFLLTPTILTYYLHIYDIVLLRGMALSSYVSRDAGVFPAASVYDSLAYGIGRIAGKI